ncbi:MAG: pectate lyase [Prevotella sp.]|nr:pectate lyase [Prevotella sp.]MBO5156686.1 pectate lyase [Prevotella sp.]
MSAVALCATAVAQPAQAPAFPGAEGFARYTTTGGRGGKVIHVTNLNDSGTGSLRWALGQSGKKIIVFDVSGYIDLRSQLNVSSNTTIAGQTAPGEGITLRYYTLYFGNADNVIVRFIRSRRSQVKDVNDGADATWGRNRKNIILDHCSFSWSIDEVASFYDNLNFTMQWCNVTEGLANPGHSKGAHSYGGIWGGKGASFHHNYISHVQNRAPRFNGARYNWNGYDKTKYENSIQAEQVDFRNCVIYNWGNGNGCYGGPGGGYINMINNYYKAGPGTKNRTRVTQVSFSDATNGGDNPFPDYASRYYISGNYVTAASNPENYDWKGVIYDSGVQKDGERYIKDAKHYYGSNVEYVNINGTDCVKLKLDNPIEAGEVTTHSAQTAYEKVLDYCGASLWRDAADARYAEEAATGTTTFNGDVAYVDKNGKVYAKSNTKGILDFINDPTKEVNPKTASYPELKNETRPANFDTDGDGIPDAWETANGLNPNDASDAVQTTIDTKGWYTNIEVYANSIVEHIVKVQNADAITAVEEYYPAFKTPTGIGEIDTPTSAIQRVEYFALDGSKLPEPVKGINIRKITYSNGKVGTDKVIK